MYSFKFYGYTENEISRLAKYLQILPENRQSYSGQMSVDIRKMKRMQAIDLTFDYEEEAMQGEDCNKQDEKFDRVRNLEQLKELPFPFYVNALHC